MNSMCKKCVKLNHTCPGTDCEVWNGCVYQMIDTPVWLPIIEKQFEGYNVPFVLRLTVSNIIRRFNIAGMIDGMYLANVIAYESGFGDGAGKFTAGRVKDPGKVADRIMNAYRASIDKDSRDELELMLVSARLYRHTAVNGLKRLIRSMRKEKSYEEGGRYTKYYIRHYIHNATDAIDEINGALPEGYTPDYYIPGMIRTEWIDEELQEGM